MRVLLCVDQNTVLDAALAAVDRLVETKKWDELLVFHAAPPAPLLLAKTGRDVRARRNEFVNEIAERLSHLPLTIETIVATGDPAELIAQVADSNDVDLIVMGARGESRDFPVGSVSQKVVSRADTDVLVVRELETPADEPDSRFAALITVDGSRGSETGISSFSSKLRAEHANIHLVHIVESLPTLWALGSREAEVAAPLARHAERVLESAATILAARGLNTQCEWHHGSPARQILDVARQRRCDVIVVGSQGHSRLTRLMLAPLTNRILRYAPCSVLCARAWSHEWAALTSDGSTETWEPQIGTA